MIFDHDVELTLQTSAALINTETDPQALSTVDDLADFVEQWSFTGVENLDADQLEQVRVIRSVLRSLWTTDEVAAVEQVNELLRSHGALPQLVRHSGFDWHIHAIDTDSPLADRIVVEHAMAMVEVIRDHELFRLKFCAAEDCDNVLVDLSRNRSRRFCDAGCGNRANVAAYRARQRELGESDPSQ